MKKVSKHKQKERSVDWLVLAIGILSLLLFICSELRVYLSPVYHINAVFRALQAACVCIILYCGARLHQTRTHSQKLLRLVCWLFFILYIYLVLTFTLLDQTLGRGSDSIYQLLSQGAREHYIAYFVNVVPFRSIYNVYIVGLIKGYVHIYYTTLNLLGNMVVLMPLAFFLPLFFKQQRKWYIFLLTATAVVVLIELLQFLFMVGSCDIDDLLLNAGGAMLMFGILRIPCIKRITQKLFGNTLEG